MAHSQATALTSFYLVCYIMFDFDTYTFWDWVLLPLNIVSMVVGVGLILFGLFCALPELLLGFTFPFWMWLGLVI